MTIHLHRNVRKALRKPVVAQKVHDIGSSFSDSRNRARAKCRSVWATKQLRKRPYAFRGESPPVETPKIVWSPPPRRTIWG